MGGTFDAFFRRAEGACGVKSQSDLATLLGVHRSAVTQAKNKDSVPKAWALTLSRTPWGSCPAAGARSGGMGRPRRDTWWGPRSGRA